MAKTKATPEVKHQSYDARGYLPQLETAYTALSIIRAVDENSVIPVYIIRQTDIIDGQVVQESDSHKMMRSEAIDRLKLTLPNFVA